MLQEKETQRKQDQAKASLVAGLVPTLAKTKTTKDPKFYTLTADAVINGKSRNKGDNIPFTSDAFNLLPDSIKALQQYYSESAVSKSGGKIPVTGAKEIDKAESTATQLEKLQNPERF